ncbi:MAG TPA: hypothetical protein VJ720_04730, partial [Chitinophaga sp.]|nr:hypothetical protein [Chitinophaga sp.]
MRKILFFLLLSHQAWAQFTANSTEPVKRPGDSLSVYNQELSPAEMKQDLQLFLDIRKKAN